MGLTDPNTQHKCLSWCCRYWCYYCFAVVRLSLFCRLQAFCVGVCCCLLWSCRWLWSFRGCCLWSCLKLGGVCGVLWLVLFAIGWCSWGFAGWFCLHSYLAIRPFKMKQLGGVCGVLLVGLLLIVVVLLTKAIRTKNTPTTQQSINKPKQHQTEGANNRTEQDNKQRTWG